MIKVLIVNLEGKIGGAETSLLLMVKYLQKNCSVGVACPGKSPLSQALVAMKANFYELNNLRKYNYSSVRNFTYWLKTSSRLIKIVKKENPDFIHANSFYAGLPCILAAVYTRKKIILHARDLINFNLMLRLIGIFCQKVIATSDNVKNDLVSKGLNPEKVEVITNGVDESEYSTDFIKYGLRNQFVFANVGQFVPWKNQINFLKASSIAAKDIPSSRFAVVGDDIFGRNSDYKKSITDYARTLPIKNRIDFWGWQKDMRDVWPKVDCLVHCAEREPFGRVIIEAMAHKIPVIAINSCGPSEIIQNGKTGILIQPGDISGLSKAMITIAEDKKYAQKLGEAGCEKVKSTFLAEKTAEKIHKLYIELLR